MAEPDNIEVPPHTWVALPRGPEVFHTGVDLAVAHPTYENGGGHLVWKLAEDVTWRTRTNWAELEGMMRRVVRVAQAIDRSPIGEFEMVAAVRILRLADKGDLDA